MQRKTLAAVAATAALALGATACGGSDDAASSTAPTPKPTPVATIPSLTGQTTVVALDAGFVEALGRLTLTPAPLGDATITDAGVAKFPITGGTVTYSTPGTLPGKSLLTGKVTVDGKVAAESAPPSTAARCSR